MKTIEQIEKDISKLEGEITVKNRTRMINKILDLRNCIFYLKANPSEEFIRTELEKKRKHLQIIEDGFETWKKNTPNVWTLKNPLQTYNTQMNKKVVASQVNYLEYLLD